MQVTSEPINAIVKRAESSQVKLTGNTKADKLKWLERERHDLLVQCLIELDGLTIQPLEKQLRKDAIEYINCLLEENDQTIMVILLIAIGLYIFGNCNMKLL